MGSQRVGHDWATELNWKRNKERKKNLKNWKSIRQFKWFNINVIRVLTGEMKRDKLFEEITGKNSPIWWKKQTYRSKNLIFLIQEIWRKLHQRASVSNCSKLGTMRIFYKQPEKKRQSMYRGTRKRMAADFSWATVQERRKWSNIFKSFEKL